MGECPNCKKPLFNNYVKCWNCGFLLRKQKVERIEMKTFKVFFKGHLMVEAKSHREARERFENNLTLEKIPFTVVDISSVRKLK